MEMQKSRHPCSKTIKVMVAESFPLLLGRRLETVSQNQVWNTNDGGKSDQN